MQPITLEDFYNDPDFYGRVERAAQRERAAAVRAGLHWLREYLAARVHALSHSPQWTGRLG